MCFKNLFKRKKKENPAETKRTGMFSNITTQEQFNERLLMFYQQECALDDERSYFVPQDSLFGETLDNAIRIRFLRVEHPEFYANINDEEFRAKAKENYLKDKEYADNEGVEE